MNKFVLIVEFDVKPEQLAKFGELIAVNARASVAEEPGCRQFDVLVDPNERTRVMLYEVYDDESAFEAHQQTPHFKKYLAEAVPLLASRERQVWKRV